MDERTSSMRALESVDARRGAAEAVERCAVRDAAVIGSIVGLSDARDRLDGRKSGSLPEDVGERSCDPRERLRFAAAAWRAAERARFVICLKLFLLCRALASASEPS